MMKGRPKSKFALVCTFYCIINIGHKICNDFHKKSSAKCAFCPDYHISVQPKVGSNWLPKHFVPAFCNHLRDWESASK